MPLAIAHAPAARPDAPPADPGALERALAFADSGAMPLAELIDRANAFVQNGQSEAAASLYEHWIAHTESALRHVASFNRGTLLGALGRPAQAEQAYLWALRSQPGFAQARLNLGHQIERQGRPDEAIAHWRLIADAPHADDDTLVLRLHAVNNIARLSEELRRFDCAEKWLRTSLALKAAQLDVIQHYVHLRQKQCAWPVYAAVPGVTANQLLVGTSPLAMLGASDDPALQLLAARRFAQERVPAPPPVPLHAGRAPRSGRIKLGYLSGDLCLHAVGLLTPELFELHDRSRFEVHAFCWSRDDGTAQRTRLLAAFDHHWPIGNLTDAAAAELIAAQGIDVLVDLQGLTSGARPAILGMRPAPVQVSYLGFPGTCALPGVEWIVADRFVMPPELLPCVSEQPLYLPACYQVSDRRREVAPAPTRGACGLPDDAFVFCSFNNNFKFSEPVFRAWMRVLHAVPGSVLWLLADNDWARENMLHAADAQGVARERLVFAPRTAPPEYLARLQLADLFLDTFPYNAGTTANDALWMGVPILTRAGRSYISRMAGSLLNAVGLPELVTETLADYERLAVLIGRTPARAASYKRYLAEHGRSSKLFDVPGLVRDLEHRFEQLALERRGG